MQFTSVLIARCRRCRGAKPPTTGERLFSSTSNANINTDKRLCHKAEGCESKSLLSVK